jgi:selenocysteine lyase/cysteine desulfurase
MLDLLRLRADTPGANDVIHLNNAGASLMPQIVLDTVVRHLEHEAYLGGYEAAGAAAAELERVYESVARLLNAQPDEIAIVENATRAWDMAFYSLPLSGGDIVLTSVTEYAGNYIPYLQLQQRRGIRVEVIPNDHEGQISIEALRKRLGDPRVKLISLPAIATNGGPVQPVEAIGAAARDTDTLFLLDACQAAGHLPLDVQRIGCHMLTATSRKYLRGPRGVGFLFIERDLCRRLEPSFLDLHAATLRTRDCFEMRADARRFESWECNVAAKLGMGAAIDYALALGVPSIWARIQTLAASLREQLSDIDGVTVRDIGAVRSGIVTFTLEHCESAWIMERLAQQHRRINVSCSTFRSTMLDMQARGLRDVVRASVHAYNSDEEIAAFVQAVKTISERGQYVQ